MCLTSWAPTSWLCTLCSSTSHLIQVSLTHINYWLWKKAINVINILVIKTETGSFFSQKARGPPVTPCTRTCTTLPSDPLIVLCAHGPPCHALTAPTDVWWWYQGLTEIQEDSWNMDIQIGLWVIQHNWDIFDKHNCFKGRSKGHTMLILQIY